MMRVLRHAELPEHFNRKSLMIAVRW